MFFRSDDSNRTHNSFLIDKKNSLFTEFLREALTPTINNVVSLSDNIFLCCFDSPNKNEVFKPQN